MYTKSTGIGRVLCAALLAFLCFTEVLAQPPEKQVGAPVVFVCEHGNVKSLIASSLFDKAARERGLPFHSVSRGITPDAGVSLKITEALRDDRIEIGDFKPRKLTSRDVADSMRVIAIGVDLTGFETGSSVRIDTWDEVPPASVDYTASKNVLLKHINALLTDLQASQRK